MIVASDRVWLIEHRTVLNLLYSKGQLDRIWSLKDKINCGAAGSATSHDTLLKCVLDFKNLFRSS